jgi:cation diffusion facilitator CzcD-associated flavoprotein CzcO
MADYKGQIVHPQTWPENLDYKGKRIVVIGSGATAATLIPSLAGDAAHVTMLQRSPTYFITGRNANQLADELRELEIDEHWIHEIVRRKLLKEQQAITNQCLVAPEPTAQFLIESLRPHLPEGFDMKHFTPSYKPWRQRIAFVPDADLFKGIKSGKADVVTGEIDRFVENGIRLKDGTVLEADIVITATGFNMNVMGDIAFALDGRPIDWSQTVTYRGMMFTGVPNLVWVFGYFRASWTLRADLVADFVCRLLGHMEQRQARAVTVQLRPEDEGMEIAPWIDTENFNPNYLLRALDQLPRRGLKPEWQHTQDYWTERKELPAIDLDGAEFHYAGQGSAAKPAPVREPVQA